MGLRKTFRRALLGISLALMAASTGDRAQPQEAIPYVNMLQAGSAENNGLKPDGNVGSRYVQDAFRRAAAGEDVVNAELVAQLTNYNVKFNRGGEQATANMHDFAYYSRHLFNRPARGILNGGMTAEQRALHEREIHFVAWNFGAPEATVRKVAADWQKNFKDLAAQGLTGDPAIDRQLARHAFGLISPQEEEALGTTLDAHADKTGQRRDAVHRAAGSYGEAFRHAAMTMQDKGVAEMRAVAGTAGRINGGEVEVSNYDEGPGAVMKILFPSTDRPARQPPGTASLWELLFTIHEAEHVTQAQPSEIDADAPVMRVLKNHPELRDYYLQWRHVTSFRSGPEDGFSHDTATALRLWELTGRAVDMEALAAEKSALIKKIDEKLDGRCIAGSPDYCALSSTGTGNIMGAVAEILRDDKTLTPVQRAQAETYLKDAAALGYTANPGFPRKPVIAASSPAPRAPGA